MPVLDRLHEIFLNKDAVLLLLSFLSILSIGPIFIILFKNILSSGIKQSLRIAVIGKPRAGKTTLITILFDNIISNSLAKNLSVAGTETIDRITSNLSKIKSGLGIAPTLDNDVFAYRFLHSKNLLGIVPAKTDVEIADFPGEYSEELANDALKNSESTALFRREFFSWVIRADRYLFVIDSMQYYKLKIENKNYSEYIDNIDILFKNAILTLKQEMLDEKLYNRSALIVFTKCDHFLGELDNKNIRNLELELGLGSHLHSLDEKKKQNKSTNHWEKEIEIDFESVLKFFKANFRDVRYIFHSSYLKNEYFDEATKKIVDFCVKGI